jgi:ABC-type multidrug transport system ATPase subunit
MSLLELDRVEKRYGGRVALDDVSLSIERGEMVVVLGERRSGRSTLLSVAAGIETPDRGAVRFEGRDLRDGDGAAYCLMKFQPRSGTHVLEQLVASQLMRRVPQTKAHEAAWRALARVDGERYAGLHVGELRGAETVRVAIARALACEPHMIVIDEPTLGLDVAERDEILALLRSLADDGVAVLASAGDGTGMRGADRVLMLDRGTLRGKITPELAPVSDLAELRRARA